MVELLAIIFPRNKGGAYIPSWIVILQAFSLECQAVFTLVILPTRVVLLVVGGGDGYGVVIRRVIG